MAVLLLRSAGGPARSGLEDDRSRLAGSNEDAPDDETMDEMPDADEITSLERRALAAEEAQDVGGRRIGEIAEAG